MNGKRNIGGLLFVCIALFILIIDTKTATDGAYEGLQICIETVIPSIFPFIILTSYINSRISGSGLPIFTVIGKHLGIPCGAESLLCFGLIGGYPIGAQCISEYYHDGKIDQKTAERLLGFCNNAGPSFIFGISAAMFSNAKSAFALWGIQILSALIVGWILPGKSIVSHCSSEQRKPIPFTKCVENAIRSMACICGWIVLFRMIINILHDWILWFFSREMHVVITGILELANGCCDLRCIDNEGLRFIICSSLLSFGGLCVIMQTQSVCKNISIQTYLIGKTMQTITSVILAYFVQSLLITNSYPVNWGSIILCAIILCTTMLITKIIDKKTVAIPT